MTDAGAKLSLKAIGKQDEYIKDPDVSHSLFNYKPRQHTNFIKVHKHTNINRPEGISNWPFGNTVIVTMNPRNMGDLLSNMYIYMKFPKANVAINLADQLGRHIIKTMKMRVDDLVVDIYYDDWGIIYDELYLDASEKRTKRYTLNRNLAEDSSNSVVNKIFSQYDSELMIPVPFFFSRKYEGDEYASNKPNRPYFPVCAIHNQKITFEIEFHNQSFFTDSTEKMKLDSFDIITEEINVSKEERTFLMTNRNLLVSDFVMKHPSVVTESNTVHIELVPNIPVKSLHWFFRDPDANFLNRFNFSSNTTYSVVNSFFEPVMENAKIYIKGEDMPNFNVATHSFYKYIIPFNNRLSRPNRNIYTYSFSMNPINVEPSGSLDFSQLQSNKTKLEVKLVDGLTKPYDLIMYYVGYKTFVFDKGFMSLAY